MTALINKRWAKPDLVGQPPPAEGTGSASSGLDDHERRAIGGKGIEVGRIGLTGPLKQDDQEIISEKLPHTDMMEQKPQTEGTDPR